MRVIFFLGCLVVMMYAASCSKDSFITSPTAGLALSDDSLAFDTLFTTTGSITHYFKIYNTNNQKLRISQIALRKGDASYFRLNADGTNGPVVNDIEMEANDSIYVFVTVQIDPSQEDLPFIIGDSIQIAYNGNEIWVPVSAWGQNAVFLKNRIVTSDTTWKNTKPVVITGGLLVAEGVKLTIQKGTKVYVHADAPLIVDGTLEAVGEKYDSTKIVFRGDRLDRYYRDFPGAWPGIFFRESSKSNLMRHVIVKNAYQGVVAQSPATNGAPKLVMEESIVDNCYDAGILAVNSTIDATNCLISNCGKNVLLALGGEYNFTHCTDVAVSNNYISHKQPVLAITDFIKEGDQVTTADIKANFVNCIFWGSNGTVDDEVAIDREGSNDFDVAFTNCIWKVKTAPADITATGTISSDDPLFVKIESAKNEYDFHLTEGSPAVNAGINIGVTTDIEGNQRQNNPDIGAYETTF
jgi:hypothetical protein